MNSYLWEKNIKSKALKPLMKDIETDILIIGGGITGMSLLFNLKDSDKKIVMVDQYKIGYGVTRGTTGKLTYLQETIYQELIKNNDLETANLYLKSQLDAINIVKNNIIDYNIKCNFEGANSYIFTTDINNLNKMDQERLSLTMLNRKYKDIKKFLNIVKAVDTIKVENTAVFHPLKYIIALKEIVLLKKNINIYENTQVTKFIKHDNYYEVFANGYKIKCKTLAICCHYPFFILPGLIPFKTYLEKSYIAAIEIDKIRNISAISIDSNVESIRYHNDKFDNYIIYLSNSHRLGINLDNKDNIKDFKKKIKDKFGTKPKYLWTNYDLMTSDKLPLIGRMKKDDNTLLIATGYNTWGMTNGTIAGSILADIINDKENEYEKIFDPRRKNNINGVKNLIVNNMKTGSTYILNKVKTNYDFYNEQVKIVIRKGKKYGIYTDSNNKEHIVKIACPHMKCSLVFNYFDKTWDCPCHGSRFDIDGNVLKGPSTYSIKV